MVQTTEAHPQVKGWSGTVKGSDGAFAEPVFSSSASSLQSVTVPRQKRAEQELQPQKKPQVSGPAFGKSSHESQGFLSRAAGRVTNIFKKENLVSTFMTIGFMNAWANKTGAAFGFKVPSLDSIPGYNINVDKIFSFFIGKDFKKANLQSTELQKITHKPLADQIMAVGAAGGLIANMMFFMTKRRGEIPPGDTIPQKILNTLKNPDKHSVHFSNVSMGVIVSLIGSMRIFKGTQGMYKLHSDDKLYSNGKLDIKSKAFQEHASGLVAGLSALIFVPMAFFGLFKIKDEKDKEEKPEPGKNTSTYAEAVLKEAPHEPRPNFIQHVKDVVSYAFKHDKKGVTGRMFSQVIEMGYFFKDGLLELQKDPTNRSAYNNIKGGLMGLLLNTAQFYFVYDRMLTNSKKQGAAPAR